MNRKLGATHLDALDTLDTTRGWFSAAELADWVGRDPRCVRTTLKRLVRDLAVEVERAGKSHRYRITGRGRAVFARKTRPGDFPPRRS